MWYPGRQALILCCSMLQHVAGYMYTIYCPVGRPHHDDQEGAQILQALASCTMLALTLARLAPPKLACCTASDSTGRACGPSAAGLKGMLRADLVASSESV